MLARAQFAAFFKLLQFGSYLDATFYDLKQMKGNQNLLTEITEIYEN